jgi:hypothetical protein
MPIRPPEDALGQDHAPPAAFDREGRRDQTGRLDARESGGPGGSSSRSCEAATQQSARLVHVRAVVSRGALLPHFALCVTLAPFLEALRWHGSKFLAPPSSVFRNGEVTERLKVHAW